MTRLDNNTNIILMKQKLGGKWLNIAHGRIQGEAVQAVASPFLNIIFLIITECFFKLTTVSKLGEFALSVLLSLV